MRFGFGRNWQRYVRLVDRARIDEAKRSLAEMLDVQDLHGRQFLDVGCGSGLFSLAAHELGAEVRSFDYDPDSVSATESLRERFAPEAEDWTVERGDVLDEAYVAGLGQHDVVYSWGVLHHTGEMWAALDQVVGLVQPGGRLFIALYNDQGPVSRLWALVKRTYNRGGPLVRGLLLAVAAVYFGARRVVGTLIGAGGGGRGMSWWYDIVDWVGGWPFEVAAPGEVIDFYRDRGFVLDRIRTVGGKQGCNEFVFTRTKRQSPS